MTWHTVLHFSSLICIALPCSSFSFSLPLPFIWLKFAYDVWTSHPSTSVHFLLLSKPTYIPPPFPTQSFFPEVIDSLEKNVFLFLFSGAIHCSLGFLVLQDKRETDSYHTAAWHFLSNAKGQENCYLIDLNPYGFCVTLLNIHSLLLSSYPIKQLEVGGGEILFNCCCYAEHVSSLKHLQKKFIPITCRLTKKSFIFRSIMLLITLVYNCTMISRWSYMIIQENIAVVSTRGWHNWEFPRLWACFSHTFLVHSNWWSFCWL